MYPKKKGYSLNYSKLLTKVLDYDPKKNKIKREVPLYFKLCLFCMKHIKIILDNLVFISKD